MSEDYLQLIGRVIVDLIKLLNQLCEGCNERFEFLLRVEDIPDLVKSIFASLKFIFIFEYDLPCAFLDNIIEDLLVVGYSLVLEVDWSHETD